MELLEIILLGIIQGIAEWLPISSEGINSIVMTGWLDFNLFDAVKFSIWLHTGTLLAALVYFRKDIKSMLKNLPQYFEDNENLKDYHGLTSFLIVSTIFTVLVGVPLFYLMEKFSFQYFMILIGVLLILNGILQRVVKRDSELYDIKLFDSVLAGIFQGFAVLPGLSRSGLTSSILLIRKYNAKMALRISFLMSIPAVLVANIGLVIFGKINFNWFALIGIFVSFVFGLITIKGLVRIAEKVNFGKFCIFTGVLSIIGGLL